MKMKILAFMIIFVALSSATGIILVFQKMGSGAFVKAVYGSPPMTPDGQVNASELFRLLEEHKCNTFNYLIRNPKKEIEGLKSFLPEAKNMGINVWVTILPPSELGPESRNNIDFVDYIGIARSIAEISKVHENLDAWSIDNVLVDRDFFTSSYLEEITSAARKINPNLKFIPVVYYPNIQSQNFDERSVYFDGIQFYYTNFPASESDESKVLLPQLEKIKSKFNKPVILGIYATPWSPDYPTSPEYVEQLINLAKQHTDGVMIYSLGQEGEKLAVIKQAFRPK